MSIFHRFIRIIIVVLMFCVGFFAVANIMPSVWVVTKNALITGRFVLILSGVVIWMMTFLFIVTGRKRKYSNRYLSFNNEGGAVSISTDAISDYLTKLMTEFPSVVKMKSRIIPLRGSIDIQVKVRVKSGSQVHEMCALLQQRVRQSMAEGLGISDVRRVEISVDEIATEHVPG